MYALKDKVSEKLSYFFADSPPSNKYSSLDQSQARPHSKGGKYLSSFFSYIRPSASTDGLKSNKHHDDAEPIQSLPVGWIDKNIEWREEHLNSRAKSDLVCGSKETQDTHEENEEPQSARSNCDSDVFEEAIDSSSPERSMPNLTEDSIFISSNLYEFLQSSLPNIAKGRQWVLLYSTLKHGISLRTLIRKSADLPGPCLLIAGDMQGAVFGGLLEGPLNPTAKRKYQGTNQTFVFTTIYGEPRLFRPTGVNRYFYLCLNDLLALGGGGHFALCFDEDLLSGSSGPCDTFGNLCLASSSEFQLKNVELWGFTHLSQYLT